MRVLIADDNALYRGMLEKNMAKWGYDVVIAEDGQQAWEILQGNDAPRLVILDWQMPNLDGIDACRRLKHDDALPFIYVIMLTGRDSDEDMVLGLDAGADDYLTKPIEPAVLRSRLSAARRILKTVPTSDPLVPQINGFDIKQMIGKGAYATIWEATHEATGKRVAVKMVRVDLASRQALLRFGREVEMMRQLNHPNIAHVYDSHMDDSQGYCAMEFIDGVTLEKYVQQESPSAGRILKLIHRVCLALEHAHSLGIVHRDLKPSNIMVTQEGQPKLVDFGLGKSLYHQEDSGAFEAELSMDGMAIGTPMFMAPEQARAENEAIDARTDVYSLGVVLYVLLLRRHPHNVSEKDPWQTLVTVGSAEANPPSDVLPGFNARLSRIVMKALAKEPEMRYQSAAEFADEIRQFLQDRLKAKHGAAHAK